MDTRKVWGLPRYQRGLRSTWISQRYEVYLTIREVWSLPAYQGDVSSIQVLWRSEAYLDIREVWGLPGIAGRKGLSGARICTVGWEHTHRAPSHGLLSHVALAPGRQHLCFLPKNCRAASLIKTLQPIKAALTGSHGSSQVLITCIGSASFHGNLRKAAMCSTSCTKWGLLIPKYSALQPKDPAGDSHHLGQGKSARLKFPLAEHNHLVNMFLSLGDPIKSHWLSHYSGGKWGRSNGAPWLTPSGFYCLSESWGTGSWQLPICKQHLAFSLHFHDCFDHEVLPLPL